jgi:hypothetical protein
VIAVATADENPAPATQQEESIAVPDESSAIIKIPTTSVPSNENVPYSQLSCSDIDRQKITHLVTTIAENGKLVLLFKYQRELRQIGREIEHVHPLRFLGTILSDPTLKSSLKEISRDYFKWSNFIDGLANGLTLQAKQNRVNIYLNDFAKEIGVKPEVLQGFVNSQEWEKMALFLINN